MGLSKAEEQLMECIWKNNKVFMKELIEFYPEPKPASTTIATLLKRMQEKGYVGYKTYGNSREYFPLVSKDVYFSNHMKSLIKDFFNDSPAQFASFFTTKTQLSTSELEELKKIIDHQINEKES